MISEFSKFLVEKKKLKFENACKLILLRVK